MKAHSLPARDLSDDLVAIWRGLLADRPDLANPYFAPEYTRIVGAARPDAQVLVLEDAGEIVGFLPHHRGPLGLARPVGELLTDYQGVIGGTGDWSAADLLRAGGLRYFGFNHVPASQAIFLPHAWKTSPSPAMAVGDGLAAYLARLNGGEGVPNFVKQLDKRKKRRLEREVGPLRFEVEVRDPLQLGALLDCKSRQYRRTGAPDILARPWVREVLERIFHAREAGFHGLLSLLYAGDTLVAGHFGMCSGQVWHYWFPCYDPAYGAYSPGQLLLLEMAAAAAGRGLREIDLGRGDQDYKLRLMTHATPLLEGAVSRPTALAWARRDYLRGREALRTSAMAAALRPVWRRLRAGREGDGES